MARILFSAGLVSLMLLIAGGTPASQSGGTPASRPALGYSVHHVKGPLNLDAKWDRAAWKEASTLELTHYMGQRPEHFPRTQAKLLYDDQYVYVIFRVEDRYVRAACWRNQGPVCRDSCVEFFFTPAAAVSPGYFNIEMNCGGTMLMNYHRGPRQGGGEPGPADLARVKVAHSLPKLVMPERQEPTVWTVEYAIPIDLLARLCRDFHKPAPGVVWRANLYKCADGTSHPHWLTWAPVDLPKPDFHRPDYFGRLEFK